MSVSPPLLAISVSHTYHLVVNARCVALALSNVCVLRAASCPPFGQHAAKIEAALPPGATARLSIREMCQMVCELHSLSVCLSLPLDARGGRGAEERDVRRPPSKHQNENRGARCRLADSLLASRPRQRPRTIPTCGLSVEHHTYTEPQPHAAWTKQRPCAAALAPQPPGRRRPPTRSHRRLSIIPAALSHSRCCAQGRMWCTPCVLASQGKRCGDHRRQSARTLQCTSTQQVGMHGARWAHTRR